MNKKIVFISLIILVLVGFLAFWYYREKIFSKEILKLEILSQDSVKMGDEIEYTIKYKNNGNFVLERPKLVFELPEGFLTEDNKRRLTENLKDIYPGDENFVKFKTRLLGKEGDLKVSHAWLSYSPKNISARYESDTTFTTKINNVPITLDFDLPSKIEKGKEITYSINYFSNVDYPLENLSIKIDPINGFDFKSSDPPSLDNLEWKLSTLNKAQGGKIQFKGVALSEAQNNLNFLAKLGMWRDGSFVVIKETSKDVQIIQSLLFISQQINGSFNYIAKPQDTLHYEIFFRNIGSTPFDNLFVMSKLDGLAYDLDSLQSGEGQTRPSDSLIVWDSKQVSKLQYLMPQQEVKVDFTVKLRENWVPPDSERNNTIIKNTVSVFDISQQFNIKVNSKLEVMQKAYHSNQLGIENSGPVPPQVNVATSYTVTWQVKNYFNDAKNVKVKAFLPQNVSLSDSIFPENQASNFSLDSASREIVWFVGDLGAGTGIKDSSPSISFQISLTPSFSQKGTAAELIGQATVSGEDQFTGAVIKSTAPALNTSLPDDQANSGGGIVQ